MTDAGRDDDGLAQAVVSAVAIASNDRQRNDERNRRDTVPPVTTFGDSVRAHISAGGCTRPVIVEAIGNGASVPVGRNIERTMPDSTMPATAAAVGTSATVGRAGRPAAPPAGDRVLTFSLTAG